MKIDPNFFNTKGSNGVDFSSQHLLDVGGKKVKFENCVFNYGLMERAYFHAATFYKCKFIGTRMLGCNFRSAVFTECEFQYATFKDCIVPLDSVLENLPYEPNQRRDLIRALRVNAASMGDYDGENQLISMELKASTEHHWNVALCVKSYYKKYSAIDRAKSFAKYLALKLEDLAWGYGVSPIRFLILVLAICTAIGLVLAGDYPKQTNNVIHIEAILFGLKNAIYGLLDFALVPADLFKAHQFLFGIVAALRITLLGLFVTVLYRRYARR